MWNVCEGQITHSHVLRIIIFCKISLFHCRSRIILDSGAAPLLTVCRRNTANKSIREGWGQRKEIGFCQACRQVLHLEYVSHIKSTFIGCNPLPLLLSPVEVLRGSGVLFNEELLGDKPGYLLRSTVLGAKPKEKVIC